MELNKPIQIDKNLTEYMTNLKKVTEKETGTVKVPKAAIPIEHPKNYMMGHISVSPPDMIITYAEPVDPYNQPNIYVEKAIAVPLKELRSVIRYLYEN